MKSCTKRGALPPGWPRRYRANAPIYIMCSAARVWALTCFSSFPHCFTTTFSPSCRRNGGSGRRQTTPMRRKDGSIAFDFRRIAAGLRRIGMAQAGVQASLGHGFMPSVGCIGHPCGMVLCPFLPYSHARFDHIYHVVAQLFALTHYIHVHCAYRIRVLMVVHVVDILALQLVAVVVYLIFYVE